MVVSIEIDVLVELGIVYVVTAMHFMGGSVIVVHISPSPGVPSVTVLHSDCEQAGRGGQPRFDVAVGVVGHAGFSPGTVKVVGRTSTVLVQPSGGGVEGPVQVMGGAHGGTIGMMDV